MTGDRPDPATARGDRISLMQAFVFAQASRRNLDIAQGKPHRYEDGVMAGLEAVATEVRGDLLDLLREAHDAMMAWHMVHGLPGDMATPEEGKMGQVCQKIHAAIRGEAAAVRGDAPPRLTDIDKALAHLNSALDCFDIPVFQVIPVGEIVEHIKAAIDYLGSESGRGAGVTQG